MKAGETRESVMGILVRLSPEDGEKLKQYDTLQASHEVLLAAAKELVTTLEFVITNPITAFEIRLAKDAILQGRAAISR